MATKQTAKLTLTFSVDSVLIITAATPPDPVLGQAYSYQLNPTVSGGTPPYGPLTYGGTFPAGLSVNSTGLISGTPTATGPCVATISVTDSGS